MMMKITSSTSTPTQGRRRDYWYTLEDDFHWHIEVLPRLTQVAGFEWGTGLFINPTAPEDAAGFLREVDLQAEPAPGTASGEAA